MMNMIERSPTTACSFWLLFTLWTLVPNFALGDLSSCAGTDCFQKNQENVHLIVSERNLPSLDLLCRLGDSSVSEDEIYENVKAFCHNPHFDGQIDSISLLKNDAILSRAKHNYSDTPAALAIVKKIVTDDRFYPDIINLYLGKNPCGLIFRGECLKNERENILKNQNRLKQLALSLRNPYYPYVENCLRDIFRHHNIFSPFEIHAKNAEAFCLALLPLNEFEEAYSSAFPATTEKELTDHLRSIAHSYVNWADFGATVISYQNVRNTIQSTSAGRASFYEFRDMANAFSWNSRGRSKEILYSPFFLAFLNEENSAENLWFTSAHEFGHSLTIDEGAFNESIFEIRIGSTHSVRSCSEKIFRVKPSFFQYLMVRKEVAADFLAIGALAMETYLKKSPEKARQFLATATNSLCASFYASGSQWAEFKANRALVEGAVDSAGHPFSWNRINGIFANNRLRSAIGCKPLEGTNRECHNWDSWR